MEQAFAIDGVHKRLFNQPDEDKTMRTKLIHIMSMALILLLGSMAAQAQFKDKSFPNGLGQPELMYRFLVPEGVTVTSKTGEVMKAGSIVTVPGSNIRMLAPEKAKEQANDKAFMSSFMNASQYFDMPEEKTQDHTVIVLTIPEGVTVEGYGKTLKGGSELVLMIANKGSEAMPDTHPAGYWNSHGWDMK